MLMLTNVNKTLQATALLACFLSTACASDDFATIFGDISWRVRCGNNPTCIESQARELVGIDGEFDQVVSCTTTLISADRRNLSFVASLSTDTSIDLEVTFPAGGGDAIEGGCSVEIVETNTFVGDCSAAAPTIAVPCQVTNLVVNDDGPDGPDISGNIFCDGIPRDGDLTDTRDIASPSSSSEPATFRFANCRGL